MKEEILILDIERHIGGHAGTHSSLAEETQNLESVFRGMSQARAIRSRNRTRLYRSREEGWSVRSVRPARFDSTFPRAVSPGASAIR